MKKALLLGSILCISLGITACTKSNKEQEESKVNKGDSQYIGEDGKPLTEEELRILDEEINKDIDENTKYKFGKVLSIQGDGKVEVILTDAPQGYSDKGYNNDLNIDTSKLKETEEKMSFNLIGTNIASNIDLGNTDEVKYVRIGIYEFEKEGHEGILENGKILSVDKID